MPSQSQNTSNQSAPILDDDEVQRFQRMATEWWDATGKFRPLHQIGPARLTFIRDQLVSHFDQSGDAPLSPLADLSVLDIGCGGGLISEPLNRMGAKVTGIDPGDMNVAVAKAHAKSQNLDIDYQTTTVEALADTGAQFDAVVCLEVVEHVPDVAAFIARCITLVRPGGMIILSTINRTVKAYALAIVGAEYILRWLPRGTHQWERFVTPDEMSRALVAAGMEPGAFAGMVYNPLTDTWSLHDSDTSVNYLAAATRPSS
ncbi:MAG: bifunctional 2-polyprenyl-6-hydroxyphenol methylase/3-demethylubiquinol 3-O-methyltransferase UbiG [Alphaproteobacteria bacterium]|nr:bifunctional 2-polyprenyl-6-hydroxyphenol methylase/3-demethylubiquinol 3-O-methyltransferase UbiG [Alphaproteobacteria bacterium]